MQCVYQRLIRKVAVLVVWDVHAWVYGIIIVSVMCAWPLTFDCLFVDTI